MISRAVSSFLLVVPFLLLFDVLLVAFFEHRVLLGEVLQLEREGHNPHEELVVDLVLLVVRSDGFYVFEEVIFVDLDAHGLQDGLQTQLCDQFFLGHCDVELLFELEQLASSVELVERNVLGSVESSVLPHLFNGLLEHLSRILEADLIEGRQDVWIGKVFLPLDLDGGGIFYFRVNSGLWRIVNPLAHKDLILLAKKVRALSLSFVIHPMPLKVVSASLGQNAITAPLAHVPHSFVDIAIGVDHSSLSVGQVVHPHAVVSISSFVEHGASSLFWIVLPVSSVLPPQFILGVSHPKSALAVSLVLAPSALIFISIRVVLNSKAVFLVVLPVPDVLMRADPFIGLLRAILIERLFLFRLRYTFTQ